MKVCIVEDKCPLTSGFQIFSPEAATVVCTLLEVMHIHKHRCVNKCMALSVLERIDYTHHFAVCFFHLKYFRTYMLTVDIDQSHSFYRQHRTYCEEANSNSFIFKKLRYSYIEQNLPLLVYSPASFDKHTPSSVIVIHFANSPLEKAEQA